MALILKQVIPAKVPAKAVSTRALPDQEFTGYLPDTRYPASIR